jgi:hypothetical protein
VARVDPSQISEATRGVVRAQRRHVWEIALVGTAIVLLFVVATRLVPHPIGPARTYDAYARKASTTAESAESQVQTAILMADTASAGNAFGPYTALVISDAEEALGGIQGTFDSIQPPDARADALGAQLDPLLSGALAHLRTLRIAARRGEISELATIADPLRPYPAQLQSFQAGLP